MTKFNFTFNTEGDYKAELSTYITKIIEVTKRQVREKRGYIKDCAEVSADEEGIFAGTLANRNLRMQIIEDLTDAYVAATGERPEVAQLERLTDAILEEELSDPLKNKMRTAEYPIMSDWQLDVRHDQETGDELASSVGTDGRNHRRPIRRKRSDSENRFTDRHARIRNKERRQAYRDFTKVHPVTRWNLHTGEVYKD